MAELDWLAVRLLPPPHSRSPDPTRPQTTTLCGCSATPLCRQDPRSHPLSILNHHKLFLVDVQAIQSHLRDGSMESASRRAQVCREKWREKAKVVGG